jgi:hypothetical protein
MPGIEKLGGGSSMCLISGQGPQHWLRLVILKLTLKPAAFRSMILYIPVDKNSIILLEPISKKILGQKTFLRWVLKDFNP